MRLRGLITVMVVSVGLAVPAAQATDKVGTVKNASSADHPITRHFRPSTEDSQIRVDYTIWDEFLATAVLDVGPPERRYLLPPEPVTGSLVTREDKSRLRFEGNRFLFSKLKEDHKAFVEDYVADLIDIANTRGLAVLNRDEQLAFWLNLYNASVIDFLAQQYPVRSIDTVRDQLFAAKRYTIQGIDLSLDDIRLRILQPIWQDPRVIYGLFQGHRGGPDIRTDAYTAETVWAKLDDNAETFVRSLRGVQFWTLATKISSIYAENADYFKDFESDVRAHLEPLMTESMRSKYDGKKRLKATIDYDVIADTRGGRRGLLSAGTQMVSISYPRNIFQTNGFNLGPNEQKSLLQHLILKKIRMMRANVTVEEFGIRSKSTKTDRK